VTEVQVDVATARGAVFAGTVFSHRRRGAESATFAYSNDYLATPGSYAIGPELPLASGARQTRAGAKLFGALTDCAPDRWGRRLITRREAALARLEGRAVRSLGEVDFLLGVRDDLRQGALRFRHGSGPYLAPEDTGVPVLTDLPALLDLATRAESDTLDLPDLQRLIRVGGSLGGARPKAHVLDSNGRIAIAKFPSANNDTWNVMAWEKVALDLAKRAGIDVPESHLLNLAGRSVVVVDRFDRATDGGRIGYVSAMTMLEASEGDQRSYLEIADVIETYSARATEELRDMWKRIVFSVLISNTDDHLRNHGFLHERGDVWRLAPAFDLNPNPAVGPKYLSTSIDGSDDAASLASAVSVASYFRLSDQQANDIVDEMKAALSGWRDMAGSHGLSSSEISAMESAFEALARA
jgi:serine/threonine-protein kinase HipA